MGRLNLDLLPSSGRKGPRSGKVGGEGGRGRWVSEVGPEGSIVRQFVVCPVDLLGCGLKGALKSSVVLAREDQQIVRRAILFGGTSEEVDPRISLTPVPSPTLRQVSGFAESSFQPCSA